MNDTNTLVVWFASVAFASTLFTACSLLMLAACRRSSAAMRCNVSQLAVVGLAVLPALCAFSPKLSLGWLTVDAESPPAPPAAATPIEPALQAESNSVAKQASGPLGISKEPATFAALPNKTLPPEPNTTKPSSTLQQESRSSIASAFEQSTLEERDAASWLAWLLVGYFAGVLLLVGRLVAEFAWASRVKRRAEPLPAATELAGSLRVGGIENVEVFSADVPVPMVVGVLRPAILIPRQAETWSDAQLTSALSHELAHIDRKDLPMQLVCSIVRCFYWPQPLVHIMLKRLRADTELACDHLAVSRCRQPAEYARHLLSIATECINPPRALSAAVPMFRRGETQPGDLETRVAAVLSPITQDRPRLTWLLAAMLLFCLMCSAIPTPVQAVPQTPELATNGAGQDESTSTNSTEASAAEAPVDPEPQEKSDVWRVSGTVVDSRGKPVPNASIVTWLQGNTLFHPSSDNDGQFALVIPKAGVLRRPHTWFFAPGHGVRAALLPIHEKLKHSDSLTGVEIPLPAIAERPLKFRILNPNGKPLAGATVRPYVVHWPNGRFMADEPTGLLGPPPPSVNEFLDQQSDLSGRVALSNVPYALVRSIAVETKEYGLQEFTIRHQEPGEEVDLQLIPTAPLSGRLLAPNAVNLEGITLEISSDHFQDVETHVRGIASVDLSSTGEFFIPQFPIRRTSQRLQYLIGWNSKSMDWAPNADFQPAFRNANIRKTEQGYDIEIPTVPTVRVQGIVKTTDTNRPLSDVHMSFRNPSLRTPSIHVATNDKGVFHVKLPAGKNTNQIFAVLDREEPGKYACATTELQVSDTTGTVAVPAVYLAPVPKIAGIVQDASGTPATGVRLGVRDPNRYGHLSGIGESQVDGRFEMPIYDASRLSSERVQNFEWFEIVKPAEGTKPRVLRELEVLDRDPTATVLRRKE